MIKIVDLNLIKDELAFTDTRIGQMLVYKNDYIISYALMTLGEYCHQEIDIMCLYLNKDSLYLDIGTNIGYHAKAVHLQSGGCNVLAFEPHPTHFRVAEYNCINLPIVIYNAAVGDGSTTSTTISDFDVSKSENYGEVKMIEGTGITVPLLKIDDLELLKCDVMKLDVENQELAVLKGSTKTIKKFKPVIFYEAIPDSDYIGAFDFLSRRGYNQYWCPIIYQHDKTYRKSDIVDFGMMGVVNILAVPKDKEQPANLLKVSRNEKFNEAVYKFKKKTGTL
jgi:FkbM family methyltransferase